MMALSFVRSLQCNSKNQWQTFVQTCYIHKRDGGRSGTLSQMSRGKGASKIGDRKEAHAFFF